MGHKESNQAKTSKEFFHFECNSQRLCIKLFKHLTKTQAHIVNTREIWQTLELEILVQSNRVVDQWNLSLIQWNLS